MTDLDRVLELQTNDTTTDQLKHRRQTLAEHAELKAIDAREAAIAASVVEPRAERDSLGREQKRLEDEIAGIEQKVAVVLHQLYEEGLTSPKEAQALQADLESLKRRQAVLEDEVLELMEKIEPLDEALTGSVAELETVREDRERTKAALVAAQAAIDAELAAVAESRIQLAAAVSPEMLKSYEELRPQYGGIAIARLVGPTCQGCFLSLAAAEVDELRRRPADELVHCPDCGRILVR
ncbi:COG1579 Zn-ribbon protein, possibly nucleic acid-binding [Acidimicrobiia bacterium]